MKKITSLLPGILITIVLAVVSQYCAGFIPNDLISAGVFAMLIGMIIHPLVSKLDTSKYGIQFVSKTILKAAIVLMGAKFSFSQVLTVGKYSLIVMTFTLITAFGCGNLLGKLFKINWKLSNLISAGTGICGGSAIAAIAPTIEADDNDIAYAISATFLFDIIMVVLFPIAGRFFGMSDMGYGLWTGTAVNDTSAVVAAGYAFSDAAGNYATIVKLTRTLSIVPIVLIFSYVNQVIKAKSSGMNSGRVHVNLKKIFPWFILLFLGFVALRSIGIISVSTGNYASDISKFAMVMALGAIGLKTDFKKVAKSGFLPVVHGFIVSVLVVSVSFLVQLLLHQI